MPCHFFSPSLARGAMCAVVDKAAGKNGGDARWKFERRAGLDHQMKGITRQEGRVKGGAENKNRLARCAGEAKRARWPERAQWTGPGAPRPAPACAAPDKHGRAFPDRWYAGGGARRHRLSTTMRHRRTGL